MQWSEIVGHDENISVLKAMLKSGRIPHALLFVGADGIGKSIVAKTFAAGLLCTSEDKPCGLCQACCRVKNMTHPDLFVISPDGASIKIDQVRELQREAALAPYYGKRRVGIIEAAETMTTQAANSFLKTLEEPAGDTVFILVSSARQQLLDTIISRCRIMPFYVLSAAVLTKALIERGVTAELAKTAAHISGGRMGTALKLVSHDGLALRNQALDVIVKLPDCEMTDIWEVAACFDNFDREQALNVYKYLALILRDLLIYLSMGNTELLFNIDLAGQLARCAHNWSEHSLIKALRAVEDARKALAANANIRLTSEALLIKLRDAAGED